ncbi:actin-binding protein wsp1-like [Musa acuminata AAA Group]|uniref:actin-binding protein wsp1-like n=1 Tax=Musa acuminata AAA Group TaxID=214697 RepID=UPI0031D6456D
MDSTHSTSLRPSSGGSDDFHSRFDTLSAFLHSSSSTAAVTFPPSHTPSISSSDGHHFFDYSYLDSTIAAAAAPWPRSLIPSPSTHTAIAAGSLSSSSVRPPPDQSIAAATAPRSSKKRSRASRRAPTTVLTTDTSNFRAMVQEFTGVPSPPFAAAASASPFARSRFDLFHSAAPSPPHFLLRPLPQKVRSPPSTAITNPATSRPPTLSNTITTAADANGNTITPTDNTNYRLPSHDLGHGGGRSQPIVNPQIPILDLQSHLQAPLLQPKYSLPAMASSFSAGHSMNDLRGLPPGLVNTIEADGGDDTTELRPVTVGDYRGCKPNYPTSDPSDFNRNNASESFVSTRRDEGMVESWIHSSE